MERNSVKRFAQRSVFLRRTRDKRHRHRFVVASAKEVGGNRSPVLAGQAAPELIAGFLFL